MGLFSSMRDITGAASGAADGTPERRVPCKAVIVATQPMGRRGRCGHEMYTFALTVIADGRPPYQTQVGSPVPVAALPLLYPGNVVPAQRMPDGPDDDIVIEWGAALALIGATA